MENKKIVLKKKKTNAFLNFSSPSEVKGLGDFDDSYIDTEVHEVPKKVGKGEFDYVMEEVVIVHKKDIREYIQSQAGDVGVYAYIDRASRGLVDIESVGLSDDVIDMSQAPTTLMEAAELGQKAQQNFAKLDPELTKGVDMATFLANVTAEDIIKFYANKAAGEHVEVKEDNK